MNLRVNATELRLIDESGFDVQLVQSLHGRRRSIGVAINGEPQHEAPVWHWFEAEGPFTQTQLGRFHYGYIPESLIRAHAFRKPWVMEQVILAITAAAEEPAFDDGVSTPDELFGDEWHEEVMRELHGVWIASRGCR